MAAHLEGDGSVQDSSVAEFEWAVKDEFAQDALDIPDRVLGVEDTSSGC